MTPGIINPFSEKFIEMWAMWKQYKQEQHGFKYKGVMSEQAALMEISRVSEGSEEKAVEIIRQSMANGWKGFFKLKGDKQNGQSKPGFREGVQQEFNRRYGSGK